MGRRREEIVSAFSTHPGSEGEAERGVGREVERLECTAFSSRYTQPAPVSAAPAAGTSP